MSILDTQEIHDAYYSSADYDNITVLLVDPRSTDEDFIVNPYHIEVRKGDVDYDKLVSLGWDTEKLMDSTAEYKRRSGAEIMNIIDGEVRRRIEDYTKSFTSLTNAKYEAMKVQLQKDSEEKIGEEVAINTETIRQRLADEFLSNIISVNVDADYIFKIKLSVFGLPEVKAAPAELKKRIRKSTSVMSTFAILDEIFNVEET